MRGLELGKTFFLYMNEFCHHNFVQFNYFYHTESRSLLMTKQTPVYAVGGHVGQI